MNTIEALEYAAKLLARRSNSRVITATAKADCDAALETLTALRDMLADQNETRERERAIREDWVERAGAPLRATEHDPRLCGECTERGYR